MAQTAPSSDRSGSRILTNILIIIVVAAIAGVLVWTLKPTPESVTDPSAPSFGFDKTSDKLQVGFVLVGPTSDWGFNYQHNQGRLAMEARLRDKVHTVVAENIPETAEVERVMQRMINEGAELIYATSYGYLESALRVAEKNPNVTFMHCLGGKQITNLGTYGSNMWEVAYVAGVVAAMTSKENTQFGFVTSHPIPPVLWIINAFALGAQSVNKDITVDTIFTNSWYNPAAETEAVNGLVGKGIGLVYILVDSGIAGVQAAERAGIYSLSQHADLSSFAPKGWVTGSVWGWTNLYENVTQSVIDKTWKNGHIGGGLKEGYAELAPFGPAVSGEAQQRARELIVKIASGELNVFAGPIYDTSGKERVPAGESLPIDQVLSMDWVVQGVRGLPNP
ncbi:MAG: BMP family ABC transporter substrate-binding protein [Candidatus Poribacteria bacterium]|nr:BMP family ABC transporter substrate-binding protein [Candidatus Poribacteria bacterium]